MKEKEKYWDVWLSIVIFIAFYTFAGGSWVELFQNFIMLFR